MALLNSEDAALGQVMPDFTLPDLNGEAIRLRDAAAEAGCVVAFICNHCPYVHAIVERLVEDAATLRAQGVGFLAVMSNDYVAYPADAPARMKDFAQQHGFGFPYLLDDTQETARAFGAVCTPDLFGVNRKLELIYRGRLDDWERRSGTGARQRDLVDTMLAAKAGAPVSTDQRPSIGCSIKWKDEGR